MTSPEKQILSRLQQLGRPEVLAKMAHFDIDKENTLGIALPDLRALAKEIGRDHLLALALWRSGILDARLVASMVAAPAEMDRTLAGS